MGFGMPHYLIHGAPGMVPKALTTWRQMMKAYIKAKGKSPNGMYFADVVSEQDYHDGGQSAHSYRAWAASQDAAMHDCEFWCHKQGMSVVPSSAI
jgi:hypothetical protein